MRMAKNIWRIAGWPIILLAFFSLVWFIWNSSGLPQDEELIRATEKYFHMYGYWIVLVSAIVEGMLVAGLYYPGSLVIFLGVIFAGKNIPEVILVVFMTSLGLAIAYIIDYLLGRYGWYRLLLKFGLREPIENAQHKLTEYGPRAIFLSYWHPNLAALTSTAAGILQFPIKKFAIYSILSIVAWNIFWGTLAYLIGERALNIIGIRFAFIVAIIWLVYRIVRYKKYIPTLHSQSS